MADTGAKDGAGNDIPENKDGTGDDTPENKEENKDGENGDGKWWGEEWNKEDTVSIDAKELASMKKTLSESQKLIKKFEKEKKDKSDAELLEKWNYEELLNNTKSELETKIWEYDTLKGDHDKALIQLEEIAGGTIAKFVEVHWQEKLDEIKSIVGEDKLVLAWKLPSFEKLVWTKGKLPADKWTPAWWWWSDRRTVLRKKAEEGTLNRREKAEFRSLISS